VLSKSCYVVAMVDIFLTRPFNKSLNTKVNKVLSLWQRCGNFTYMGYANMIISCTLICTHDTINGKGTLEA
jgi:hypothetical protein